MWKLSSQQLVLVFLLKNDLLLKSKRLTSSLSRLKMANHWRRTSIGYGLRWNHTVLKSNDALKNLTRRRSNSTSKRQSLIGKKMNDETENCRNKWGMIMSLRKISKTLSMRKNLLRLGKQRRQSKLTATYLSSWESIRKIISTVSSRLISWKKTSWLNSKCGMALHLKSIVESKVKNLR